MAKKRSSGDPPSPPSSAHPPQSSGAGGGFRPSPASLASLVALGAASAFWALLLWGELVVSRVGGTPFCTLGEAADCTTVWNSAFASAVHRTSGLPVAAWGVAWGLVAFALPLAALLRLAEGRPQPALVTAIRLAAAVGILTVFVMVAVSAAERAFCIGCAATYVLAAGYGGIALFGWPGAGLPEPGRGAAYAATATLVAFLLLLYPGTRTPREAGEAGREAVTAAARGFAGGPGTGDADRDRRLRELVDSLQPGLKQTLADSLHIYRQGPAFPPIPPRRLDGPPDAPVRITEWTDVLCTHCAELHRTLSALRSNLPPGSFAVESRQFPLDAECNSLVERRGDPVRCLAARANICLEGHEKASEFTAALFEAQEGLTPEKVHALAAPYLPRPDLERCLASPETARRLAEDVEAGARYHPDGTPIVAVNGRRGTSFGPFLYAMVLTGGADSHPAFASLPAANPQAHIH